MPLPGRPSCRPTTLVVAEDPATSRVGLVVCRPPERDAYSSCSPWLALLDLWLTIDAMLRVTPAMQLLSWCLDLGKPVVALQAPPRIAGARPVSVRTVGGPLNGRREVRSRRDRACLACPGPGPPRGRRVRHRRRADRCRQRARGRLDAAVRREPPVAGDPRRRCDGLADPGATRPMAASTPAHPGVGCCGARVRSPGLTAVDLSVGCWPSIAFGSLRQRVELPNAVVRGPARWWRAVAGARGHQDVLDLVDGWT